MTTFKIQDQVTSTANAQRLTKGATYTVVNVIRDITPWGTYVKYILAGPGCEDGLLEITNGHVLLQAA
jgi:hypothetical protein